MKDHGPPWWIVVPGSIPVVQVRPAFVVVAHPMLLAPPPKTRPVWKAATTVLPWPNESGSTWVLCWLSVFVYGSWLIGVGSTLPASTAGPTTSARQAAATLMAKHAPLPGTNTVGRS